MTGEAFAELFRAHYGAVLAYGLRRVDPATAHDVAAETFLVAWRRLGEPPSQPRPWLLAVARGVLANELRRSGRARRLDDRVAGAAVTGEVVVAQPDHAEAVAATDRVSVAMDQLSSADREVLQLVAWEGLDHAAAARVLGCSVTAVKVRVHRARRRLGAVLQRADADPPAGPAPTRAPVPASSRPDRSTDRGREDGR